MPRPAIAPNSTPAGTEAPAAIRLPVFGPARIEIGGHTIRLRRKSLAILYYLAVEGSTRRQLLADLLWEQLDPARNLRVELHHIRRTLARFGLTPFESSADPLVLPFEIQLEQNDAEGEPFEGLEGLSPPFQAWLEEQRALLARKSPRLLVHRELVATIASRISLPYLLILSAEPDAGQETFVGSLAARLVLRKTSEIRGGGPALRHLPAGAKLDEEVVRTIVEDDASLWVVEQSSFGEDSALLLRLRGSYPPSRTTYLELPGLGWQEVIEQLHDTLPFAEAAELYTETAGHPGFLREQLELRGRPGELAALPQRIRAAYQLEARRLPLEARYALERASIHPGPMSEGVLRALDVEPHLVELERRHWLVLDEGWRFRGTVARNAIYRSLPRGQSKLYHGIAARYFESTGEYIAAEYHRSVVAGRIDWQRVAEGVDGWAAEVVGQRAGNGPGDAVAPRRMLPGAETPLLESRLFGEQVEAQAGEAVIVRRPLDTGPSGVEWQLLPRSGVLNLRGRVYARSALEVGFDGDAAPLRVEFLGAGRRTVIYAPVDAPLAVDEETLLLPLEEELNGYLAFENCLFVRVSSSAEAAVLELTLTAYEAAGNGEGSEGIEAY